MPIRHYSRISSLAKIPALLYHRMARQPRLSRGGMFIGMKRTDATAMSSLSLRGSERRQGKLSFHAECD